MERVEAPEGVTFEEDTVGGISGWWAKPAETREGSAILHLHGGWFNWGTAQAFCNLAGHIALRAGAPAFIPDYRLAPEHPFPAAVNDAKACYRGLVDRGIRNIALSGDSAGGNLALVLLSIATAKSVSGGVLPVGAVTLSPVTDLALSGATGGADLMESNDARPGLRRIGGDVLSDLYAGSAATLRRPRLGACITTGAFRVSRA